MARGVCFFLTVFCFLWPAGAATGCRCRVSLVGSAAEFFFRVLLSECGVRYETWVLVSLQGWLRESYVMIGPDLPCGTTPKTNSAQIWLSWMTMKKRAAFIKGLPGLAIHMTRSISTLLSVLCL